MPARGSPHGPAVDGLRVAGQVTRVREAARKALAETGKRDAEA